MSRLGVCRMLRDCDGGKHLFSEMMRVANGGVGSPGRRKYRCSGRSRHWMDAWSPGNGRTLVQERRANDVFIDCPMRCCFGNLVRPRGSGGRCTTTIKAGRITSINIDDNLGITGIASWRNLIFTWLEAYRPAADVISQ